MMMSSVFERHLDNSCLLFISTTIKQLVDFTVIELIYGIIFYYRINLSLA